MSNTPQIIKSKISQTFPQYGPNKVREITRLVYEIAKRDRRKSADIVQEVHKKHQSFDQVKAHLLKLRYPHLSQKERAENHLLPELDINPDYAVPIKSHPKLLPDEFIVEDDVKETSFVDRLKSRYSEIPFKSIPSYRDAVDGNTFTLKDYNDRTKKFYIVKEKGGFFFNCPCSPGSVSCGYHTMNLGFGCAFECVYCYLPSYTNAPGILLPANIEEYFEAFEKDKNNIRVGTGQFTDSLVFDHITEYSPKIVEFFNKHPESAFEFKTKSDNIDLLLSVQPKENIMVAWSVNPQKVIDEAEYYTASLEQRLEAAQKCQRAGYKLGFHFDPIIYYEGWEDDYSSVVDQIFATIDAKRIGWISLGCLRMTAKSKQTIENRFPDTWILDGEMIGGYDGKIRYSPALRKEIYQKMHQWIKARSPSVTVYLCMEEDSLYKEWHFQYAF